MQGIAGYLEQNESVEVWGLDLTSMYGLVERTKNVYEVFSSK